MPFRLNPQYFNPTLYRTMRSLWFDGIPETARVAPDAAMARWFGGGTKHEKASFDQTCHVNARPALESIGPSNYPLPPAAATCAQEKEQSLHIAAPFIDEIRAASPPETPASTALSLFLLLDQMTRNVFRADQALIYAHYDRLSRALAHAMLSRPDGEDRWDLAYRGNFIRRSWFYLPLMHSEHLEDHEAEMKLMRQAEEDAAAEGGEEARHYVQRSIKYEEMHSELIKRFGRYPHRNKVLGREDSKEELEYLNSENAQTFGTG